MTFAEHDRSTATAAFATEGHLPVLIEDWLPITELGIESARERRAIGDLPPPFLIHLWWARRPVAAAQGVQLAALLPIWDDALINHVEGLRDALDRTTFLPAEDDYQRYRHWVIWLTGIHGDNIVGQARYEAGVGTADAFPWEKAWKVRPNIEDVIVLHRLLEYRWGKLPTVLDPTAGGGTIPYAAIRYGIPAIANDLNPVAVAAMRSSVAIPGEVGRDLLPLVKQWGDRLCANIEHQLSPFFPPDGDGRPEAYIIANAITCPRTGGPVPLVPNWWLVRKGKDKIAVKAHFDASPSGDPVGIRFEIVSDKSIDFDPAVGTISQGSAVSPWDGLVIDGEEIKCQAQNGEMYPLLYAVKVQRAGRGSWRFRPPHDGDHKALKAAERELAAKEAAWATADVLPTEDIGISNYDRGHRLYGIRSWRDMFTERQLLVHGTFVEQWRALLAEARAELGVEPADVVFSLLGTMHAKALDYNSRYTVWTPKKNGFANTFQRHNFAFKWTFAEYEGAKALWQRGLNSELLPYVEKLLDITDVDRPTGMLTTDRDEPSVPGPLTLSQGPAAELNDVSDGSVECVNIDPPYYDNVMYAEIADFFYVWEKRVLGILCPDLFSDELCDIDNEAVANIARFADAGRRKNELATFDYRQKMQAIFAECRRVLRDDGVMVVWFTHKKADAWDTLGSAIMDAGFTIETSWPVNTESSVSLHQTDVSAAKSTIVLVCRKHRALDENGTFFEDIEGDVRRAAVHAVEQFQSAVGIDGVDLLLSTYGPTLSVIAQHWPVLSSDAGSDGRARRLRPEEALAVAREEVNRLVKRRLVGHDAGFDGPTDFWLLAWANFKARGVDYDMARKLALTLGLDVDEVVASGLVKKTGSNVLLIDPLARGRALRRRASDQGRFDTLVDALHHLINTYLNDGLAPARTWLADSGYGDERAFRDVVQAAVNAVPRIRGTAGYTLDEAQELDDVVIALFGDEIEFPEAEQLMPTVVQTTLDV